MRHQGSPKRHAHGACEAHVRVRASNGRTCSGYLKGKERNPGPPAGVAPAAETHALNAASRRRIEKRALLGAGGWLAAYSIAGSEGFFISGSTYQRPSTRTKRTVSSPAFAVAWSPSIR